jgi:hypothetical protein
MGKGRGREEPEGAGGVSGRETLEGRRAGGDHVELGRRCDELGEVVSQFVLMLGDSRGPGEGGVATERNPRGAVRAAWVAMRVAG